MSDCDHETSYWTSEDWEDDYGNIHTDHKLITESFYEDLDLHRYHCTRCKKIFYYSSAASDYYEHGIKTTIIGLDQ